MKILIIHNFYQQPGGEDAVFAAESQLLSSYGHAVEKLVFDNRSMNSVAAKCRAATGMMYNRASARILEDKIKLFQPDIIHVHNFVALASPSIFFVAHAWQVPIVLTLHNYRLICPGATLFYRDKVYENSVHATFPFDAILKGVYRNSIFQTAAVAIMVALHRLLGTWKNKVDRYIVLTEFAWKKFVGASINIPEEKFSLKPNFVSDYGPGDASRENFFLFAGRLSPEKGIDTLLQSARLNLFQLVIIGDGPLKSRVLQFAAQYNNIHYLGYKTKEEVIELLKKCKALIFPSIWYEGFPVSILEAFATGTPVLASRLGSMNEIIADRINGLHFEPGDEYDLGQKAEEMLNDHQLYNILSANARFTYLREYTPEKNYKLLMKIYAEAIEEKRSTLTSNMQLAVGALV